MNHEPRWSPHDRLLTSCLLLAGCWLALPAPSAGCLAQTASPAAPADASPATPADAPSAADPAATLPARVQTLLLELEAPTAARRAAAEQQLIDLGAAVLPYLPDPKSATSAESQQRLERVRQRLSQLARPPAQPAGRPPRIQLDQASTLEQALAAIESASGVRFDHPLAADTAVPPLATELTFWHAVDYVLDEAGLDIDFLGSGDDRWRLCPRAPERPRRVDSAAYAGWFRLEPTSITSRRSLRRPESSALQLDVEISWPPTIQPLAFSLAADQLVATLDDGQSIRLASDFGTIDLMPRPSRSTIELHLELQPPAGHPQRISSLNGTLTVTQVGASERLEFTNPPADDALPVDTNQDGPVDVSLERIRTNGQLTEWMIAIRFRRGGDLPPEILRSSLLTNPVYVLDADGNRHDHLGYQLFRQNADGLGISYLFDLGEASAGAKLCYETPAALASQSHPFSLPDIRLP